MSDNVVEVVEAPHGEYRVRVEADPEGYVHNPRENDNLGVMVTRPDLHWMRGLDEDGVQADHVWLPQAMDEHSFRAMARWLRMAYGVRVALPLYSGSGESLASGESDDQADAGNYVGIVYANPQGEDRKMSDEQLEHGLRAEVDEYAKWQRGEVYGYVVERFNTEAGDWDEVESCWGCIGLEWAEQAAKEALASAAKGEGETRIQVDADVTRARVQLSVVYAVTYGWNDGDGPFTTLFAEQRHADQFKAIRDRFGSDAEVIPMLPLSGAEADERVAEEAESWGLESEESGDEG